MKVSEGTLAHLLTEQPHMLGDECAQCAEAGWHHAYYAGDIEGNKITVAEGYGAFTGYILVAKGHLVDRPYSAAHPGEFRSSEITRTVHKASEYEFHLV